MLTTNSLYIKRYEKWRQERSCVFLMVIDCGSWMLMRKRQRMRARAMDWECWAELRFEEKRKENSGQCVEKRKPRGRTESMREQEGRVTYNGRRYRAVASTYSMSYMSWGRSKPDISGKRNIIHYKGARSLTRDVEKQRRREIVSTSIVSARAEANLWVVSANARTERDICEKIFLFVFRGYVSLPFHSTYSILQEVVNLSNKVTKT